MIKKIICNLGILVFIFTLLLPSTTSAQAVPAVVLMQESLPTAPLGTVWQIDFFDEFDGTVLDTTKWNINGDYARTYASGIRLIKKSNAYLDGKGRLVLRGQFDSSANTSSLASIDTNGKFTPKYGYVSAKINYDTGAFWMVSGDVINVNNSAQDGIEIDISEKWDPTFVNQALHWDGYGTSHKFEHNFNYSVSGKAGYHEYGYLWKPDGHSFYIDSSSYSLPQAGGMGQNPGYIILGAPHGAASGLASTTYGYVDYIHAYNSVPKTAFTYSIKGPSDDPKNYVNFRDESGSELNDGVLATIDYKSPEWVGMWGGPPRYYTDVSISTANGNQINAVYIHALRSKAAGIYLPSKISLVCGGVVESKYWTIKAPTEDGLYQILLQDLPSSCADRKIRVWNGWWTFFSEITLKTIAKDNIPPKIVITTPSNGATILPPKYSDASGANFVISADASDNIGIAGVQFKIDGQNIGPEDIVAPYEAVLDTTKYANGFHSLSATARDVSGNSTSFLNLIITVKNNVSVPTPFSYKITTYHSQADTYPDSTGVELNDGKTAASIKNTESEWVGIWGGPPKYHFDLSITPSNNQPISKIVISALSATGGGIYLPPKIELMCDGAMTSIKWTPTTPASDSLQEIVLTSFPTSCPQATLRVWNGWWTFFSEIKVETQSNTSVTAQLKQALKYVTITVNNIFSSETYVPVKDLVASIINSIIK